MLCISETLLNAHIFINTWKSGALFDIYLTSAYDPRFQREDFSPQVESRERRERKNEEQTGGNLKGATEGTLLRSHRVTWSLEKLVSTGN